jgi:hypothetical protein
MFLNDDWEFNVLGIYNYKQPGPLEDYFNYILENHERVDGDLVEAGVFQGRSLLGMGLLLKELGSSKKIYGFDTFAGFPPINAKEDDLERFDDLLSQGRITSDHLDKVRQNLRFRSAFVNDPSARNLSLSGDFSSSNVDLIKMKIELLGLDNVVLVPGPFDETFVKERETPNGLMAAILDCDLYASYWTVLPFVWERLNRGGYVYLDEYYSLKFPGAMIATDEFFSDKKDKPFKHKQRPGDFERWAVTKIHG